MKTGYQLVCNAKQLASLRLDVSLYESPLMIIFTYKFSCVKKYNCPVVYSEIALGGDSFSCGDQSIDKQCGSVDWFLYGAPYGIEGF